MTCPCLFARSPTSGRAPHHDFSKLVCAFLHIWWCPYHDLSMLVCTLSCIWWRHAPTTSVSACLIVLPPLLVPPHYDLSMLVGLFSHSCHIWSCPHHDLSMLVCSFLHIWWHQSPTTTFQCLFARSRANPHHDLSVSARFFFLPRLLVPPPRPFKGCWLILAQLVRPFSECLLLLSPTSAGAPPPRLFNACLLVLAHLVHQPSTVAFPTTFQ